MIDPDFPRLKREKIDIWLVFTFILAGLIFGFVLGRYELSSISGQPFVSVIKADLLNETQKDPTPNNETNTLITSANQNPSMESEDAPVLIINFGDYECPFSKKFNLEIIPRLTEDFINTGKVRYVYRNFPLDIHAKAFLAAHATKCAEAQNNYWEMHTLLFEKQSEWKIADNPENIFLDYANSLNLNIEAFRECMDSEIYKDEIQQDKEDGLSYGVKKTPAIFINHKLFPGGLINYSRLKEYLQKIS